MIQPSAIQRIPVAGLFLHYLSSGSIFKILTAVKGICYNGITVLRYYGVTVLRYYGVTVLRHYGVIVQKLTFSDNNLALAEKLQKNMGLNAH